MTEPYGWEGTPAFRLGDVMVTQAPDRSVGVSTSDQSLSDLLVQHPTPGSGILAGQLARGLALREDPAKVTIYRLEFKASGMIRPGPTALWAGGGQLLIPSDPTIAPIGQVGHMVRIDALDGGACQLSLPKP
jgi:hypothetical protein